MAMARLVSQSLSNTTSISGLSLTLTPRFLTHPRHRSGKPHAAQLIEIDLDSSSSSSPSSTSASSSETSDIETVNGGIRKLEDAIHSMLVRRAAPDWLPFRPGASYWVPPSAQSHPSYGGIVEVMSRLSAPLRPHSDAERRGVPGSGSSSSSVLLSDDEMMSHSSDRGWPSSGYFAPEPSLPMPLFEVTKMAETPESASSDSDEEG